MERLMWRSPTGRLFHRRGPATAKERSQRRVRVCWMTHVLTSDDRSWRRAEAVTSCNTLTVSAILGQTRLPLLNPKPQHSKNKVHLQLKQTVLSPFTRWQHVYYILETWQAALARRWSGALCCSMRDVYTRLLRLY